MDIICTSDLTMSKIVDNILANIEVFVNTFLLVNFK